MLWLATALAVLLTLAAGVLPAVPFAPSDSAEDVVVQTAGALAAAIAAVLLAGRALRAGALVDVLLAAALTCLASGEATHALVLESTDAATAGQVAGPLLLVAAAFAPARRLARPARALAFGLGGCAVALGAEAALFGGLRHGALDLLVGVAYALSACRFVWRARRAGDQLRHWLAAGSVVAAFAPGELRFGFYLAVAAGLVREGIADQRRVAGLAVFEERRRMARDLHDGLAQELHYIRQQSRALEGATTGPGAVIGRRIAAAADRALDESRLAITTLIRPAGESLAALLLEAGRLPAERAGAQVELVGGAVSARAEARAPLARIVREAVSNAVRHGGARHIRIDLVESPSLRLRIQDDGNGFDPGAERRPDAFGLIGMAERVEALGGVLRIESRPGHGARVEISLP